MCERTPTDRRIGRWAANSGATIVSIYIVFGLIGVVNRPPGSDPLRQVDPYLAILEILISLAAVDLIILMAVVYAYAPADRKTFALAALAFMVAFAVLTCSVHFVSLTVGRQLDPALSPLLMRQVSTQVWPTLAMALDWLGWDFFLGLSLLFAAPVFKGGGLSRRVRMSMLVAGTLCLVATLAPATGTLQIQYLGIAGYIFALLVTCILLAMLFQQGQPSDPNER